MSIILIIEDKMGRRIRLTKERWKHITERHPNVNNLDLIRYTIQNPLLIKQDKFDSLLYYYYKYIKEKNRYLLVAVKYLNREGFILTSFYTKKIRK